MKKVKFTLWSLSSKSVAFMCIVVIFGILLIQSAVAMFFDVRHEELAQIDIIFRTAISSIFGYLMSVVATADFSLKEKNKPQNTQVKNIGFTPDSSQTPKSYINETDSKTSDISIIPPPVNKVVEKNFRINVQIIVLACSCVFCVVLLIVVRNFSHIIVANSTNTVTISQYRDIISGSIGALIGLSQSKN